MSKQEETEVKKAKVSASFNLKQFGKVVVRLKLAGLVTEEVSKKLDGIKKELINEYVKQL